MSASRRRRGLWIIVGALLVLLAMQVAFDPIRVLADGVGVLRIRAELPAARERWNAHAAQSYQVHVRGATMACLVDGVLTVQGGELVGVRMRANPLIPDSPLVDVDPSRWDQEACPFRDLTIEGMLDRTERGLKEIGIFGEPLSVEFDDEWGYVTVYRRGRASGGGILAPNVSDCCIWFEFDDLRVPASGE